MSRVGVLVLGPAGVGKTTFTNSIITYLHTVGRTAHIVNLDPAAEPSEYEFSIDIRELISLEDATDAMKLGPNGGLIYCFEFLLKNLDWLDEVLGDYDDEYLIFDCPGQIELYTHIPVLPSIVKHLKEAHNMSMCATYLLQAPYVVDISKYFSATLSAMSAMMLLEVPHLNILSKVDLIQDRYSKQQIKRFLSPDTFLFNDQNEMFVNQRYVALTEAIVQLNQDFGMIEFLPLSAKDNDTIETIVSYIDDITQWAENQEPHEPKDEFELPEDE
ncbi:hypothetical protein CANCADRAFT_230 [Tortispora caseinolytica NRRL Y-17796]|uniref:GPN-loop GTPase 3 n=1 Tax=Tortispora caseinolytica NRRL Y-17796 TaxID=767744 RepID=A0A1E4TIU8_9ASCO|nr:hypothetical protein CANCADRAFT_230 [Tortispora caseinolytica NRRL Y-17796]